MYTKDFRTLKDFFNMIKKNYKTPMKTQHSALLSSRPLRNPCHSTGLCDLLTGSPLFGHTVT